MSTLHFDVTKAEKQMLQNYANQVGLPMKIALKEALLEAIEYELEELKNLQAAYEETKRNPRVYTLAEFRELLKSETTNE